MIITFGDKYRLRSIAPCGYTLDYWDEGGNERRVTKGENKGKTVVSEAGWRSTGTYPHDIRHAIDIMAEDFISRNNQTLDVRTALKVVADYISALDVKAEEVKV